MDTRNVIIRKAVGDDYAQVKEAVFELLSQLRNSVVAEVEGLEDAYCQVVNSDLYGCIWIAQVDDNICGLLALSKVWSLHCGGLYGIIEELWVRSDCQSLGIGSKLIDTACDYCKVNEIRRVDVGLPADTFIYYSNTFNFYKKNKFLEIGTRMKRYV